MGGHGPTPSARAVTGALRSAGGPEAGPRQDPTPGLVVSTAFLSHFFNPTSYALGDDRLHVVGGVDGTRASCRALRAGRCCGDGPSTRWRAVKGRLLSRVAVNA